MQKKHLTYFLLGIGIYIYASVFEASANWITSVINKSIMKMQMESELDQAEHRVAVEVVKPQEPSSTSAIGFAIPSVEEEYDYDDE